MIKIKWGVFNKFMFKSNSKVKIELSKDGKYVVYKDEIIYIYYIEENKLIPILTSERVYSTTYFLINDKLIIIGRYFDSVSNFVKAYDYKNQIQLLNKCNCGHG